MSLIADKPNFSLRTDAPQNKSIQNSIYLSFYPTIKHFY